MHFVRRRTHCCSDATDAMNKFSELLSALGALHAKEGSRRSETMRALGKNYLLEDDVTLIAQHWERLASEKHHLSKHKLTKSEKCRMTRLRTELSPELAARVLPKLVSRRFCSRTRGSARKRVTLHKPLRAGNAHARP